MTGEYYPWLMPDGIPGDLNSLFVITVETRLTWTDATRVSDRFTREVIDAIRQGDEIIKIVITEENE